MLDYEDSGRLSVVGECPIRIPKRTGLSSAESEPMQGSPLTDRQREALEIIRASIRDRGRAPSHSEMAAAMKLKSSSGVEVHLKALARKGWIEIDGVARGIRLLREGMPIVDSEHLPAVTAGAPRTVEECGNLARLNDLESVLAQFQSRPDFFVRVEGDSLDQAGFASGDIVAVRKQPEASDGDIVLARIGAEVTLKRFERIDAEHVELQPVSTNPDHQAIEIGPGTDDAEIVGIVVGAIVGTRRAVE